jgi:hypothetical protein
MQRMLPMPMLMQDCRGVLQCKVGGCWVELDELVSEEGWQKEMFLAVMMGGV